MERSKHTVYLYWKMGKGQGGDPEGLKLKGEKQISAVEWNRFTQMLQLEKFKALPNDRVIPANDGATWMLEYKSVNGFKAHTTNWPQGSIQRCCLYLLSLTDIFVDQKDIY